MNTAYIYDIDSILKIDQKPWVISKDNPGIPLMKINESDFNLFKSGIYKHHGNKINFNSSTFWVSNSFMNKLKVKCKLNNVDISSLGISMQEYLNSSIIENIDYKINLDIFKESFNKECDIFIVLSIVVVPLDLILTTTYPDLLGTFGSYISWISLVVGAILLLLLISSIIRRVRKNGSN